MKIIKLLGVLIVLLVIVSVTLSNHSLDDSEIVAKLTRDNSSLEHANAILRAEIADQGSLTKTIEVIKASGYQSPDNIATLPIPGQVASR